MKRFFIIIFLVAILLPISVLLEHQRSTTLEKPVAQKHHDPLKNESTNKENQDDSSLIVSVSSIALKQPPSEESNTQHYTDQIEQLITNLSLEQKIGQLLIFGIEDNAESISNETAMLISEQGIGNIILFKRNLKSSKQIASLTKQLKTLASKSNHIPLWISIDQEGGKVNRLPNQYPSAGQLATLDDIAITEATGDQIGTELMSLHMDMNFAPVLDINSNSNNPVIGDRAFGENVQSVVAHSTAMLKGLSPYVITVGKHFPGHGDTNADSHYSLPTINKSWDELEQLEIIPFRNAIEQQIDAIMVGHLYLPELDEQYPASLSSIIIEDYLRTKLNFGGLVITDDLVMGGITNEYSVEEAAVRALQAGNTMLIIGHKPKIQQKVRQYIIDSVHTGVLSEQVINDRVRLVLKEKLSHLDNLKSLVTTIK